MKMRTRTLIIPALAALVTAAIVVAVIIGQLPGGSFAPATEAAPSAPDAAEPSNGASAPQGPTAGEKPAQDPDAGGREQNSSGEETGPLGVRPQPDEPLISAPLPKTASRAGAVVEGFPSAVIGLAPGSTVTFSSVASEGDRLQVGLNAMSTASPAKVLQHYRTALGELGLVAGTAPVAAGSTGVAFVRGPNTVTVTVSSVGGGSRYTVFGVLDAGD